MPFIKRLPPHVVAHIAAGEVIEETTSIIKELLDNALDADATRIEIDLSNGGTNRIKVSDNGHGIQRKSIPLLFERYATSKLRTLEDFQQLNSLGFRGEALYSIMTAADVTIISRAQKDSEGIWVKTFGGRVEEVRPIGCRVGTTVIVERIFNRYPVRKHSLEARKALSATKQLIDRYALANPHLDLILKNNNSIQLSLFSEESEVERVSKIWKIPVEQILALAKSEPDFIMAGWLSHPESFASTSQQQLLIVNNRPVEPPDAIRKAVDAGLKTFRHHGKHPRFVIQVTCPPHLIDQNIHPQKLAVKFWRENEVATWVEEMIDQSLNRIDTSHLRFVGEAVNLEEPYTLSEPDSPYLDGTYLQLDQTYIMAVTAQGYLLIDQHAADERLWYNRLLSDEDLLDEISQDLSGECEAELDDDIYQHSFPEQINARVATIACHQAIRAGEILSESQMQDLVEEILAGGNSTLVCPHGRPTHIHITTKQLENWFRRR